jgi:Rrf2 family protein
MNSSTRFAVAVHTLTLLAQNRSEPLTSEYLAASVNTNPVVIRRVLGLLRAAHLVTSQGGNSGGWRLVGDPQAVTLCAVYRAVDPEPLFAMHHRPPNAECPVGRHIQQALNGPFMAASEAAEAALGRTTLADVAGEVAALAG